MNEDKVNVRGWTLFTSSHDNAYASMLACRLFPDACAVSFKKFDGFYRLLFYITHGLSKHFHFAVIKLKP